MLLVGGAAAALALGPSAMVLAACQNPSPNPQTQNLSGTLFYTRFPTPTYPCSTPYCGDPTNVKSVTFQYNGTTFSLGTPTNIASVPAADGIVLTQHNNLLVGGQFGGNVYDVNPHTGQYTTVSAGTYASFMIGLSPNHNIAYIGSVGDRSNGQIGEVGLNPTVHPLGTITVTGPNQSPAPDPNVDAIAFANGQAFYTSSLPGVAGDFGEINLQTGVETQLITGLDAAHGMTYDSYTHDLILSGMHEVVQIDPSNPTQIVSSLTVNLGSGYFDTYDLPWSDGQGQIFAAANDGNLTFIDYSNSGLLSTAKVVQTVYVDGYLDDVIGVLGSACSTGSGGSWGSNTSSNTSNTSSWGSNGSSGSNCQPSCSVTGTGGGSQWSSTQNGSQSGASGDEKNGDTHGPQCTDPDSNGDTHSNNHTGSQGNPGHYSNNNGTPLSYGGQSNGNQDGWFTNFVSNCWTGVSHFGW